MERQIPLVESTNYFIADVGLARVVKEVYVRQARARVHHANTRHCKVTVAATVPQASEWVVKVDGSTVMVSPPSGELQWTNYTVGIIVPKYYRIKLYPKM